MTNATPEPDQPADDRDETDAEDTSRENKAWPPPGIETK